MSLPVWSLLVGVLLITMVLIGTLLTRLPLSSAMIYLGVGYVLGPGGIGLITPDPFRHAYAFELAAEAAVLISLFAVGLRLGIPLTDRRWRLPARLAFVPMAVTVGLIAAVGMWGLNLSLGAAVLLGGILAPTDPVLASGVQAHAGPEPDPVRFSLAGEGGLNDGTAFPFVMLGLGLLGYHDLGDWAWRWWVVDFLWATTGGLAIGAAAGALIGKLIVQLRTRFQAALGLDEFLSLGVIAVAYGGARLCLTSGFLAVFAAGLALQRVKVRPRAETVTLDLSPEQGYRERAAHVHHASATMTHAVQSFNEQLERIAELAIVLLVGAMLSYVTVSLALWWFIPLLFVGLRPLAVWVGVLGEPMGMRQRAVISWFGIRGIGSVFYLMFAIEHGITGALAQVLVDITLVTVAVSILLHGVSARSLMSRYARRQLPR